MERQLGRGGMATVFLAQDLKHKRPVALKVLHPELGHALGPERFHREVELAARLQHPHILTVLDSGEAAGQLWFTMPFVDGESLRDRLTRERQLPVDEAVRIATETARALDYAHRQGIIHRDIKPENILLTKDGDTLVADFGIARALTGGGEKLTETGMAVGTPTYMSPEQASGERQLDARTDVYALGAVLYEMLAGEPPFTGATAQAVIAKRFSGEVPKVRAVRPSVPPQVEAAVSRALAPVAADRFASAAEFAKSLGGSTTSAATAARPSTPAMAAPVTGTAAARPPRRVPAGLALLLIGFLIGVGVLFAWKRGGHSAGGGQKVIAVLPFENQGDSTQEYFADGITDEVRGKLAALPGLQVIASGSSREYRHTDKPLSRIASELGADYLLVAKVRWARNPDGTSEVRVSPELVGLSEGKPTTRWQQAFDASLTNVFKVQADIASQVAEALDVALADSVSRKIAARPTENLPAYDAFLRGEQIFVTQAANDAVSLRRATAYYQQAVALDSSFTLAWARLSRTQALLYANGTPEPGLADGALRAGQRALALDPRSVEARISLAGYERDVKTDLVRARQYLEEALRLEPSNAVALSSIAALDGMTGQWDSAMVHAREAVRLDPLSVVSALRLGNALRKTGRYQEARAELDRGRALVPGNLALLEARVMVELRAGNLDSARAIIRAAAARTEPAPLVAYFGNYWDLFWALDPTQQQLLLTLSPAEFDGDRASWAIIQAQTLWILGDKNRARAYADTSRMEGEKLIRLTNNDPQRLLFLGLAQAYLGQKVDAIRNGERGAGAVAPALDGVTGPYFQHVLARIYVLTGEYDKAIDRLEPLLRTPYDLSPGWLRIDPNFAPLKGNPRFDKLLAGP
ncbi:MAG TPA: protein kinase [Gemmatimonadales bacterium]|nr:protein kinase [Gemmatimonadales bacterium]